MHAVSLERPCTVWTKNGVLFSRRMSDTRVRLKGRFCLVTRHTAWVSGPGVRHTLVHVVAH
jgi:hypothetical protein